MSGSDSGLVDKVEESTLGKKGNSEWSMERYETRIRALVEVEEVTARLQRYPHSTYRCMRLLLSRLFQSCRH